MTPDERDFLHQSSLRVPTVNRVLALYAALLAGFWGGHKFLLGARREGWLYLVLALTTIPLWASLADFVDLFRQPAIGQGFLRRRLPTRHPAERDVVVRKTWVRLLKLAAAMGLLFAGIGWIAHRMNEGHARVAALCAQIVPGMDAADLVPFGATHGFQKRAPREGFNVLADKATLGRHACHVMVRDGRVVSSTHYFLD